MQEYKQKLEEEKKRLSAELATLGKFDSVSGDWQAKPEAFDQNETEDNQQGNRSEDYESKTALIKPLEDQLAEVEKSLAAIENGSYGMCTVCGNPIEKARLEANPSAQTCMAHMGA